MRHDLSAAEARRIALTSQGYNRADRDSVPSASQMRKLIDRLGLLQIDSVNVLMRAHYLPLFSRLGAYDIGALDALVARKPKIFFEYWGHEASLLPIDLQPLLRWRMERALRGEGIWASLAEYGGHRRLEADALLKRIGAEGPMAASDLGGDRAASKGMWVRSRAKHALEWLFWSGQVAATHRRTSFERVYDLPERVLPRAILAAPTPSRTDSQRALLARSAQALGVATAQDLRDYYRIPAGDAQTPIDQLVEEGTLTPVRVEGWRQLAYLHKDARAERKIQGGALLSPFDPLIWYRPRTERLFDFRYRLEIYTPAHKREHGYYVLPFLLDGALVARVDLKADRKAATLIVQQASLEPGAPADTVERLLAELERMSTWLRLSKLKLAPGVALGPEATG